MSLLASDDTIETDRLLLRRIARSDVAFYERVHADPDVARYLAHGNPRTARETAEWMDALLVAYDEVQLGQIAVVRKSDGQLVGRAGVSHLQVEASPQPDGTYVGYYYPARAPAGVAHTTEAELGYTLDRAAWGNGYAREAVRGMWDYLCARRADLRVVSLIHPENTRSIRLATSFGAKRADRITAWNRPFDHYIWPAMSANSGGRIADFRNSGE